jgi:hypothetical protein
MEIIALGAETCVCMFVNDQQKGGMSDANLSTSRSPSSRRPCLPSHSEQAGASCALITKSVQDFIRPGDVVLAAFAGAATIGWFEVLSRVKLFSQYHAMLQYFTINEVAARLRRSPRWLRDFL